MTNGRNSYPIYRRRKNGINVVVRTATLDNGWIVPYNPFLLAKYDCHLNVEVCSTIKAVKYLYKYIYKGHDRVSITVQDGIEQRDYDEISAFQSARWMPPLEAVWRIFRFCMNEIHPNVMPLQVYLQNMQTVLFRAYERLENIADDDSRKRTMLTAFFERNQTDPFAHTLLSTVSGTLCLVRAKIREDLASEKKRILWDRFFSALSEDYTLAFSESPSKVLNLTLRKDEVVDRRKAKEIEEQLSIPITLEELNAINLLNIEQKRAYEIIYDRVMEKRPGAFFVDGPGGTGKTFLYSSLLAQLPKKGFIALAVASSGIAASNISGGRTANSLSKFLLILKKIKVVKFQNKVRLLN
ncbi:uncharacterized protein LOC141656686 [Silene latifolia]|uniref:uncharacterized protein LOC141656686 n=1 Tax=Silene latifolia TaxID=37657 RepID=UPI003D770EC6